MYKFDVNGIYSFETLSPSILGQRFIGARLIGSVDYKMALAIENVGVKQVQVQADLPDGAPTKPEENTYHVFETQAGDRRVFAASWINEQTITNNNFRDTTVIVHNTQPEDAIKIKQVLGAAGYNMVSISSNG